MKKIRLWTLGYLDKSDINKSFMPTAEMINRAAETIRQAVNANTDVVDIVWGPELSCKLINMEEEQFVEVGDGLYRIIEKDKFRRTMVK